VFGLFGALFVLLGAVFGLSHTFLKFCFLLYPFVGWFGGGGLQALACAGQVLLWPFRGFLSCFISDFMLTFCSPFFLFCRFLSFVCTELRLLCAFG